MKTKMNVMNIIDLAVYYINIQNLYMWRESERQADRQRQTERQRQRERQSERQRETERERI